MSVPTVYQGIKARKIPTSSSRRLEDVRPSEGPRTVPEQSVSRPRSASGERKRRDQCPYQGQLLCLVPPRGSLQWASGHGGLLRMCLNRAPSTFPLRRLADTEAV